jgi:hypothetical protein
MRPLLLLCVAGAAFAQGTTPKEKPEDYPVHAQARSASLGAEFTIHSFSGGEQTYIARGFLVVEVALYPPKGQTVDVHSGNFVLRINGKKLEILPQSPSYVAASLAHPEWNDSRRLEGDAAAGPATVSVGRPAPVQVPGMPIPGQPVPPPQAPRDNPSGMPPREHVKPGQLLLDTALPQGEHHSPVSGFLYFSYTGRTSGIKSLELRYEDAVLKLR